MEWRWLLPLLVLAASLFFIAAVRMRISIEKQSSDLRLVLKELDQRANRLNKARDAAQESKQQLHARTTELTRLRSEVVNLQSQTKELRTERSNLTEKLSGTEAKIRDLVAALARSETSRLELEKDLSAASLVRWELQSKLQTDEAQRITAINGLRQPRQTVPSFIHLASPEPLKQTAPDPHSPLPVAKSPIEPLILELRPDLTLSDEEDADRELEDFSLEHAAHMRSLDPRQRPTVQPANHTTHAPSQHTLEVHRAPWEDAGPALSAAYGSIATALGPESLQAGVVFHERGVEEVQLSKERV